MDITEVQVKQFRIVLMDGECSCREDEVYPDGNHPMFLQDPMGVVVKRLQTRSQLYSGIHLDGVHVLAVYDGKNKL
jgi:hypothetical protein